MIVNEGSNPVGIARGALASGVKILQYRAKRGIDPNTLDALRRITRSAGSLLILNDDWRVARESDCDGVHLGPEDEGFRTADRVRVEFPDGVIGLSCATADEARAAQASGADYAGVGSVYATTSKEDAGSPIGIDGLRAITGATSLPIAAIGGITPERIGEVKGAGAAMAAVLSAVMDDPSSAARRLMLAWDES